ncbi:flavin mononucleotide hydrolase 1, chloroplatic isoform X2 [Rhodamnia argentea]|uniref:Flavin mononucleotide hydrolase 1, chloroplatic isoform X2 n=1 Tax=Rhodamnia argentea TaxID=178133 RepID=A0ABM3H3J4_9MYRT|nr:flavin mononucleotide hydrolase 1, chloroplatic isoform X2 [Rhodamnia argentea]
MVCLGQMAISLRPSSVPFPLALAPRSPRMASTFSNNCKSTSFAPPSPSHADRRRPILLFDIMDTIVRDPFYQDVPAFFGMPLKELIECKHPTSWIEFEEGVIDEVRYYPCRWNWRENSSKMEGLWIWKVGDYITSHYIIFVAIGLKTCMRRGYSYLEGIEELLHELKENGYEMHAFTNYPIWYEMIEEKLTISRYLSWTFCSCINGKRKPNRDFYLDALQHLKVDPPSCVFIDDRLLALNLLRE